MPNPNRPRPEGRFLEAKIAAACLLIGAVLAPVVEIFTGNQNVTEQMPMFAELGVAAGIGFVALEVAGRVLPPSQTGARQQR